MTNETVTMETFRDNALSIQHRGWTAFVRSLAIDEPVRVPDEFLVRGETYAKGMLRATAYQGGRKYSLRFAKIDGALYVARVK